MREPRTFWIVSGSTLLSILATELAAHVLHLDEVASAGFLLLGLVPISYGALRSGFPAGLVPTLAISAYTLHYSGPHEALFSASGQAVNGAIVMLILGIALSWPMSIIRSREEKFRTAIQQRTEALEERNQELTDANAALEAFGYVVSHDLKEPVRAVENYLDAARQEWGSDETRAFVEHAYAANGRLSRMLQGLLEYSRASSTPTTLRALRIEDIVNSDACRVQTATLFEERRVALDVDPGIPPILADEVVLCQLFGNIMLNAARHNPSDKPRIRITSIHADPGRVHVVIEDNGPGFPPEVVTRFSHLKGTRPATVKGGFGLVIAHRAAQRVGARMWLENAHGGGRVHVDLPAADAAFSAG